MDLAHLNVQALVAQLNTLFQAQPEEGQAVMLELIRTVDLGSTPRHEQFSILFRGPLDHFLPQRTYQLTHAVLGSFALFLVPVGREAEGFLYEAIFNRLVAGA